MQANEVVAIAIICMILFSAAIACLLIWQTVQAHRRGADHKVAMDGMRKHQQYKLDEKRPGARDTKYREPFREPRHLVL